MRPVVLALSLALALALFVAGCDLRTRHANWFTLHDTMAGCSASFPLQPTNSVENVPLGPLVMQTHAYTCQEQGFEYTMLWNDYPMQAMAMTSGQRIIDNIRDGYNQQGQPVLSEAAVTVGGNPGRELVVDAGHGLIHRARFMVKGNRLYQLLVYVPAASKNDPDVTRFFDSFALDNP